MLGTLAVTGLMYPFLIFPRIGYRGYFVNARPLGSDEDVKSSGWIVESTFS